MKIKNNTSFEWWNADDKEENIPPRHVEQLENHAEARMAEMQKEGYTSGELLEEIDCVNYRGWWGN